MRAWEVVAGVAVVGAVAGAVAILAIDEEPAARSGGGAQTVAAERPAQTTETAETTPAASGPARPSDAAIETVIVAYARAYSSGNVDRIVSLLTPDFQFQAAGREPVGIEQRRLVHEANARRRATATLALPVEVLSTEPGRAQARVGFAIRYGVQCGELCRPREGEWTFTLREVDGTLKIARLDSQQGDS